MYPLPFFDGSSTFCQLRRFLKKSVLAAVADTDTLLTARLDCCNGLDRGMPMETAQKLQLVQNIAVCMRTGVGREEHVTSMLWDLHWNGFQLISVPNSSCWFFWSIKPVTVWDQGIVGKVHLLQYKSSHVLHSSGGGEVCPPLCVPPWPVGGYGLGVWLPYGGPSSCGRGTERPSQGGRLTWHSHWSPLDGMLRWQPY